METRVAGYRSKLNQIPRLREAHSRVRRQRCDGRRVRPPMLLRPRRTRRAAGTGHERLDLVWRYPKAHRRQLDFLAAPAQPHLEPLSFRRAAEGALVQHPVSGALELIRRVDGPNAAGNSRKRRLPDREGDDGTGRRQLADHSFQGAGGAGRNRPPHPRDERLRVVLAHRHRVVLIRQRRQAWVDQGHAPAFDDHGQAAMHRNADASAPTRYGRRR